MKQEIEGNIKYTLSFGDGNADIQFETSIDNDLAILAAASFIMQYHYNATEIKRKQARFFNKKLLADELELVRRGKNGLRRTLDRYLELYNEYQESLKNPPPNEKAVEAGSFMKECVEEEKREVSSAEQELKGLVSMSGIEVKEVQNTEELKEFFDDKLLDKDENISNL